MIDLRSDTVTQPTPEMLSAMCSAPLGDDVLGDDPTIHALEEQIADLIGCETALFVPSGTMANQIAIWLHTSKGTAIAVEQDAHIFHYEAAAPALISAVRMRAISGTRGIMSPDALATTFPPDDPHFSPIKLVCLEDTANRGGGSVYPMKIISSIQEIARAHNAKLHLDGARLFNAQVSSGISVLERAKGFDTVSICFSKGLGAPVGSALCMPTSMKRDAIRVRKMLGGGMRQSGILAAAARYALEHNIEKMEQDHHNARMFALALSELEIQVQAPQSNMVYFSHPKAQLLAEKLKENQLWVLSLGPNTIRAVFHLGISQKDTHRAIEIIKSTNF
jgi:threonine aldolase